MIIIDKTTGKEFPSLRKAEHYTSIPRRYIALDCRTNKKQICL